MNEKKVFCAGAARGEITPSGGLMPMPFIWNYKFESVLDPIYARVLSMTDGMHKVLFIVLEMTVVPYPEELLAFVAEQTGLEKEYIFITVTHTHEAPPIGYLPIPEGTEDEKKCRLWFGEIKEAVLDTIRRADERQRPARIGYGTGKSYINVNRDEIFGDRAVLGNNYERPSDKEIQLVRMEDLEGHTIALIVNYAVHAVAMNGCLINNAVAVTGDIPGRTSAKIEEQMDGAVVFWTSGAAGDQNPRVMTQYVFYGRDGQQEVCNLGETGHIVLEHLAREHVRDILAANEKLVCTKEDVELFAAEKIVRCEGRTKELPQVPYILRLLVVGDIAFEGISAEIVTSVGQAVRGVSPYEKTILISHCMQYMGYVPDDWEYEHHAFEAENPPVGKGVAQPVFVDGFRELFQE